MMLFIIDLNIESFMINDQYLMKQILSVSAIDTKSVINYYQYHLDRYCLIFIF